MSKPAKTRAKTQQLSRQEQAVAGRLTKTADLAINRLGEMKSAARRNGVDWKVLTGVGGLFATTVGSGAIFLRSRRPYHVDAQSLRRDIARVEVLKSQVGSYTKNEKEFCKQLEAIIRGGSETS